jgi:hypothetical protein
MAIVPDGSVGGGRSHLGLVLQAHPTDFAEIDLPKVTGRFSVTRPVLLLPAGVRVDGGGYSGVVVVLDAASQLAWWR